MRMRSSRSQEFTDLLQNRKICKKSLKALCFQGCPFEGNSRSLTWKILLNYLPTERKDWEADLIRFRKNYKDYVSEFIVSPGEKMDHVDHPLNSGPESQWAAFFKDNEMLLQIYKDCRRLCPDLNFFQKATEFSSASLDGPDNPALMLRKRVEYSALQSETLARSRSGITNLVTTKSRGGLPDDDYDQLEPGQEAHWEVAERILFIYCKTNHAQSYVQGMNEVLGPIYYVFANDTDPQWRKHAEADTFFCFFNLMTEIQENFIKTLDHDKHCGISGRMQKMMMTLKSIDPSLWSRMVEQNLLPEYFAFRWITLLLSQEFNLPDVLRVWDSLLADEKRFDFLIYVCCGMLILVRDDLLTQDFSTAMKIVQHYPIDDVHSILIKANELYMRR